MKRCVAAVQRLLKAFQRTKTRGGGKNVEWDGTWWGRSSGRTCMPVIAKVGHGYWTRAEQGRGA
jgi:hypothetical protein